MEGAPTAADAGRDRVVVKASVPIQVHAEASWAIGASAVGLPVIVGATEDPAAANTWEELRGTSFGSVFDAGTGDQRSTIAKEQLATKLGGTTDVEPLSTPIGRNALVSTTGMRFFDVQAPSEWAELKFGNDKVTPIELEKDLNLISRGNNVVYHFVDDPVTGKSFSNLDIRTLERLGIRYKLWGREFWNP